jgi:hypothetical protein
MGRVSKIRDKDRRQSSQLAGRCLAQPFEQGRVDRCSGGVMCNRDIAPSKPENEHLRDIRSGLDGCGAAVSFTEETSFDPATQACGWSDSDSRFGLVPWRAGSPGAGNLAAMTKARAWAGCPSIDVTS